MSRIRHSSPVAFAVATALGMAAARAAETAIPPPPDTHDWKCGQCPFLQGYSANVEAGAEYAGGANASSGRYTGIDHNGVYAVAAATGKWRDATGTFASYQLDNLGLPSRGGYLDAGHEGLFDVRVGYDGQPTRLDDTTLTPYRSSSPGQLTLPNSWVAGNTTAAMTELAATLAPVKVEYDRRTVSLLGQFFASPDWTVYADLRHQEKTGTGAISGSFLTDAAQLPMRIDYVTNVVETGVRWTGRIASLQLAYTGSWFKNATDSLTWQNPYLPIVPGSTRGQLALAPGNDLQQVHIGGDVRLPVFTATTLTYEASYGKLTQGQAFLPPSTLPGTALLAQGSLDGDVHISHYGMALSSQPLTRLFLRGRVSYDGRDDHTASLSIPYVVTDTFPGGTYVTPRYGEDRTRLDGSTDYRALRWLQVGAAGEALHVHYAPGQVVTSTDNNRGWGHITVNPLASLTLTAKAGNARRKSGVFNAAALPPTENPLLRAYNYAPRDQNFFSLSGSWSVTATFTWALEGSWADDAYRLSGLGLQNGRDRRVASTLTWAPLAKLSVYADGSYQRIEALQSGSTGSTAPQWQALDQQYFFSAALGGRWQFHDRWDSSLDYVRATTRGNTSITSGGMAGAQPFPENRTKLDSLSWSTTYQWSARLTLRLRYAHEKYDTNDWALDGVGPGTVANFLSLGEQPYRHNVNVIALTAAYKLGEREVTPEE